MLTVALSSSDGISHSQCLNCKGKINHFQLGEKKVKDRNHRQRQELGIRAGTEKECIGHSHQSDCNEHVSRSKNSEITSTMPDLRADEECNFDHGGSPCDRRCNSIASGLVISRRVENHCTGCVGHGDRSTSMMRLNTGDNADRRFRISANSIVRDDNFSSENKSAKRTSCSSGDNSSSKIRSRSVDRRNSRCSGGGGTNGGNTQVGKFICFLCRHEYPRESTLKNHLKVYHKIEASKMPFVTGI